MLRRSVGVGEERGRFMWPNKCEKEGGEPPGAQHIKSELVGGVGEGVFIRPASAARALSRAELPVSGWKLAAKPGSGLLEGSARGLCEGPKQSDFALRSC